MRKHTAVLTAPSIVAIVLTATPRPAAAAPYVPQSSNRAVLNFSTHWLFAGDVPGGAGQAVGLDERGFVPVSLPYYRVHPHKCGVTAAAGSAQPARCGAPPTPP